jgi:hypothetical protein
VLKKSKHYNFIELQKNENHKKTCDNIKFEKILNKQLKKCFILYLMCVISIVVYSHNVAQNFILMTDNFKSCDNSESERNEKKKIKMLAIQQN